MRTLRLTAAGRAALADGTGRQVRNVRIVALAFGDGVNPEGVDDDERTALRAGRGREAVSGATNVAGRIVLQAKVAPAAAYWITEVGVIARIGAGGDEFLLGYWAAPDAGAALVHVQRGTQVAVLAVLDMTGQAVTVEVPVGFTLEASLRLATLTDVADLEAGLYLRANADGDGAVWRQAPPVVATEADLPAAATTPQSTYLVTNHAGSGYPALAIQAGGTWYFCWARAAFPENSKTAPGLVQMATPADFEGATLPDNRLATPADARAYIARRIAAAEFERTTTYGTRAVTRYDSVFQTRRDTEGETRFETRFETAHETRFETGTATERTTEAETAYETDVEVYRQTTPRRSTTRSTTRSTRSATSHVTRYQVRGPGTRETTRVTSRPTATSVRRATSWVTRRTTTASTSYTTEWEAGGGGEGGQETSQTTTRRTRYTTSWTASRQTTIAGSRTTRYGTSVSTAVTVNRTRSRTTRYHTSVSTAVSTQADTALAARQTLVRVSARTTRHDTERTTGYETRFETAADTRYMTQRDTAQQTQKVTRFATRINTDRETDRATSRVTSV